jgi:hypothetical protein
MAYGFAALSTRAVVDTIERGAGPREGIYYAWDCVKHHSRCDEGIRAQRNEVQRPVQLTLLGRQWTNGVCIRGASTLYYLFPPVNN